MVRIRCIEEADLDAVLRIQDQCYVEITPESLVSLRAKILASPGTCFVAETAAAGVFGYLIAVPVRYPELPALDARTFEPSMGADTLYIHDLAVAQAGRGTGAARSLVNCGMNAARSQGLRAACLVAIQGSVRYWEQFGFEMVAAPSTGVARKLASYGAAAQLMRIDRAPPSGVR